MRIYPYLVFDGHAREAMTFYHNVLGGELQISAFSEMPDFDKHFAPDAANRVMNAQLKWDEGVLMASDGCPSEPPGPMDGFSVALEFQDTGQAEHIFKTLSDGGTVIMPWEPTFWAAGFGMCKDKYGVAWMINAGIVQ